MISAASSAGEASMNLSGWNRASAASPSRSSRASIAVRPTSPVSIPARLTASSGRPKAFAMAASSSPSRSPIRSSPPSTLTMAPAVPRRWRGRSSASRMRGLRRGARRRLDRLEGRADLDQGRLAVAGSGAWPAVGEHLRHRGRDVGRAVVGAAQGVVVGARPPGAPRRRARTSRRRSSAGRPRGTGDRSGRRPRSAARRARARPGSRRGSPSSRTSSSSPRRARPSRSSGAWAAMV